MRWSAATILLTVLFAAQSIAAPTFQRLGELDAIVCCDDHCERSGPRSAAARCCEVESLADAIRATTSTDETPAAALSAAPIPAPANATAPRSRAAPGVTGPRARAAPIFLLVRSLRI